jgi:hypothetical protein
MNPEKQKAVTAAAGKTDVVIFHLLSKIWLSQIEL